MRSAPTPSTPFRARRGLFALDFDALDVVDALPRAEGPVEVALHDAFQGLWATVRWNRRLRDPPAHVPRIAVPSSAHARLAERAAAERIQAAEAGGLAAATMEALGLPHWILSALELEVRAEIAPGDVAWRDASGALGGVPDAGGAVERLRPLLRG